MQSYLDTIGLDLSDALNAAPALLGYKLIFKSPEGITSGYIVETEAYQHDDPASHSFLGLNKHNSSIFEQSGTVYVYFTYGLHFCVNIVTGPKGEGQAVLIRAIEPIDGIDLMMKRRKLHKLTELTNGPAKLTQAMGINRDVDGTSILDGTLSIESGIKPREIVAAPRVGISKAKDNPWRFYIEGNQFVSKKHVGNII